MRDAVCRTLMSARIRCCCAALKDAHVAISSRVRQHPWHQPLPGCMAHTPLHGEPGAGPASAMELTAGLLVGQGRRRRALGYIDDRSPRHAHQLLRRQFEHRMRMPRCGP